VERSNRILVVDDERMNRVVLRGILVNAGMEVFCASSGVEALDSARRELPDMLLLDVMMPDENGFDICMKLKQDPLISHIPVIFVTCLSDVTDKLRGLNLGAVDYITKPFFAPEIVARIRNHLDSHRKQGAVIKEQAHRLGQVKAAQQALLVNPEDVLAARFAVHFLPVLEAGGDFYDVMDFGSGCYGYFLADVSGHDLGASFITSSLKALFRQHAAPATSAVDTLVAMNTILHAIMPGEQYLTAVYLRVDRTANRYELVSAAHPPVLVQQGGSATFLDVSGMPLGMFDQVELGVISGVLEPGSRIFLYTDGLAEVFGTHFVTDPVFTSALRTACLSTACLPLPECVRAIAGTPVGAATPKDDVLLLGVDI